YFNWLALKILYMRRQYQYDARRQQGDGGGVFGDNQFTSTLSVNFHFPRIPRRTRNKPALQGD
ncbi:TPA: hypothetical protein ACGY8I_004847, partial [Aeromonas hydrophila]